MSYYTFFITAFNCILFAVCLPLLFVRGVEYAAEYSGGTKESASGILQEKRLSHVRDSSCNRVTVHST